MADEKKPLMEEIAADLLDKFDALCRKRGQCRAHAIETMMLSELELQAKRERRSREIRKDPNRMIHEAEDLQEAARTTTNRAEPILQALATEIALKAWQVRECGSAEPTHDLVRLYRALPDDVRERLQARLPEHPWPCGAEHARLSGNPFGGGLLVVLEFHRETFKHWRYAHEHAALFAWAVLDEALTVIIETYRETYRFPRFLGPRPVLGNMARTTRRPGR